MSLKARAYRNKGAVTLHPCIIVHFYPRLAGLIKINRRASRTQVSDQRGTCLFYRDLQGGGLCLLSGPSHGYLLTHGVDGRTRTCA